MNLYWQDNPTSESMLRRMAVSFEKASIPFGKLDLRESQVNGARLNEAILEHKVSDYMQGFRNGDAFPRPIVYKAPTGYVILGGNQRCEAINRLVKEGELAKSVEIEVYLVETEDKNLRDLIARVDNVAHGEGMSVDERIQHALHGVMFLGYSVADMAKSFVVSDTTINNHRRAQEVREKLQRSGIDSHGAPVATLSALASLDYDESSQTKLGALVSRHHVPVERVRQVVGLLKKQTNNQARVSKIKELEKECMEAAHSKNGQHAEVERSKVPMKPRRDKLLRLLSSLLSFLEHDNVGEAFVNLDQLQVTTKQDRDRVFDAIKKLKFRFGVISKL